MLKLGHSLKPQLRIGQQGHGPDGYSDIGIVSSMVINTKPLGQRRVAGDDSTGRLGVPHPTFTGRGTNSAHVPGFDITLDAGWQNALLERKRSLALHDQSDVAHLLFTQQYRTTTPIPLTNQVPLHLYPH